MDAEKDDVLRIDEQQAVRIKSLIRGEPAGVSAERLRGILNVPAGENVPEWLYHDAEETADKVLIHCREPVFYARIADSTTLNTNGLIRAGAGADVWKYYDKAKEVFNTFGAMKQHRPRVLRTKPPMCIREHACKAPEDLATYIRSDVDVFGYQCACGNGVFRIDGCGLEGISLTDRITLRCSQCAAQSVIFDGSKHGYDGALGLTPDVGFHDPGINVACPDCKGASFRIALGFEQTVEPDEAKESIKEANVKAKREDLFTWFTGIACCMACGKVFTFADIECA